MTRNGLILQYFNLGMKYAEIVAFISSYHGISLSVRQLKVVLKQLGRRRIFKSSIDEVIDSVEQELYESGASSTGKCINGS